MPLVSATSCWCSLCPSSSNLSRELAPWVVASSESLVDVVLAYDRRDEERFEDEDERSNEEPRLESVVIPSLMAFKSAGAAGSTIAFCLRTVARLLASFLDH